MTSGEIALTPNEEPIFPGDIIRFRAKDSFIRGISVYARFLA